jgi:hypothetical protein
MARRDAADLDPRGGERISPTRASTRVALATATLAAGAGVAGYGSFEADRLNLLVFALGAAAVVLLAAGLVTGLTAAVPSGLGGLAAAWSISAWTQGSGAPGGTILAATGIFVTAELAYWSLDQIRVSDELELVARRAAGLGLRAATALVLAAVILAALGLHAGSGLALEAVGVLAAVGLLALVLVLARAGHAASER